MALTSLLNKFKPNQTLNGLARLEAFCQEYNHHCQFRKNNNYFVYYLKKKIKYFLITIVLNIFTSQFHLIFNV